MTSILGVLLVCSLGFLAVHSLTLTSMVAQAQKKYVRGCYYTNWSQYRQGRGKYMPEDYQTGLCTHILFAFVGMNDDYTLTNVEWNDIPVQGAGIGLYARVNALKNSDPSLKTLYSLGGYNFGTAKFQAMASSAANRQRFVANAIAYARKYNFDGIDIDWEYPFAQDKSNFAALMQDLRNGINAEATGDKRLLLTIAVSAGKSTIDAGYDVASIGRSIDLLFLMSYDYWGSWSSNIGFNSPLFGRTGMDANDMFLNTNFSASYFAQLGMPKEKIIIGIATYGRGWQLSQPTTGIPQEKGAPFPAKPYTGEPGMAAYYEICEVIATGGVVTFQDQQKVPYVIKSGTEWWGYDNVESVSYKMQWLMSQGYGGAFVWALDMDDFNGQCSNGNGVKFPLINAMAKGLSGGVVPVPPPTSSPSPVTTPTPVPTTRPTAPTTNTAPTPVTVPTTPGTGVQCRPGDDYLPDPTNCNKFYRCANGIAYSFTCVAGLTFHADTKTCGVADPTKCFTVSDPTPGIIPSSPATTVHPTPSPTPTRMSGSSRTASTSTPMSTTSAGGKSCPSGSDYFPDPSDCNKFFRCANGKAYSFTCAAGTSFHADTRRCDYTDKSKCYTPALSSSSTSTSTSPTSSTSTTTP